jgi:hypothetical protein
MRKCRVVVGREWEVVVVGGMVGCEGAGCGGGRA